MLIGAVSKEKNYCFQNRHNNNSNNKTELSMEWNMCIVLAMAAKHTYSKSTENKQTPTLYLLLLFIFIFSSFRLYLEILEKPIEEPFRSAAIFSFLFKSLVGFALHQRIACRQWRLLCVYRRTHRYHPRKDRWDLIFRLSPSLWLFEELKEKTHKKSKQIQTH